jgi:hypothetical protein
LKLGVNELVFSYLPDWATPADAVTPGVFGAVFTKG